MTIEIQIENVCGSIIIYSNGSIKNNTGVSIYFRQLEVKCEEIPPNIIKQVIKK